LQNGTTQNNTDFNEQNSEETFSTAQNPIDTQLNPFEDNLMSIENNNESNDSLVNENELSHGKKYLRLFIIFYY
jgi:hypothetical protein